MQVSRFLKRVFAVDAASCLLMGGLLAIGHTVLGELFGLPRGLVLWAGLALVPVGLFILWVATRDNVPKLFVWAIILGNAGWVAESLLLIESAATITPIGRAFVLVQALAVATLTALEAFGATRAGRGPVAARA